MNDETARSLTAAFDSPLAISDEATPEIEAVWVVGQVEVALVGSVAERRLRALWRARQGKRATPLLLISAQQERLLALGPRRADEPIRSISVEDLVRVLNDVKDKSRQQAAVGLADALERQDRTGIPGLVIRGLLTKHVLTRRLRRYRADDWKRLEEAASKVRSDRGWRENLAALGYRIDERRDRGYLLRHDERPVAVVLPLPDAGAFSRMTPEGSPPEALLVTDCRREGVEWGLLATDDRFRLFPAETAVGAATARYVELDVTTTEPDDWPYIGLLAPESLAPGGLLEQLVTESVALGAELRETVEGKIREHVLPTIARGLGDFVAKPPRKLDLSSPSVRQIIEDATLLLLFRILFFLYLESKGYLPLASSAYRPHSATQLLSDARAQADAFDERATLLWSRFETLIEAMRTGSTGWGLPAYNGDLFAVDVLPGAELLEEARVTDAAFGPALLALASDPAEEREQVGVDYGDLEIAHLGRIYEGLLSLRLSLATEPLVYDRTTERWVPAGKREGEIAAGELFYQSKSGGRKAEGVYYTPQIIVRHLVNRAVLPALEEHLAQVAEAATRNIKDAADMLLDFRILDPAMGSAHFLADALDRVAERIGTFLADHPLKPVNRLLDELRAEASWEGRIEDGDLFRRLVLKRCIYGVDVNPIAVEVGKISLWLASFVPGLSLAYLGHNLRLGDALVGVADPGVLSDLGPYFTEYEGAPIPMALALAREVAARIAETADRTPEEVEASREVERELREVTAGLDHVFSVWCSEPFGIEKARGWLVTVADKVIAGEPAKLEEKYLMPAIEMADQRRFFHWPVEFPEAFARERPGFDVVVGNPPWEELTIEELAFYAIHDPGLRGVTSEAERRRRIEQLVRRYPYLQAEFERRRGELKEKRRFFGPQGGYVAQGAGDTDTYKLFCERYRSLVRPGGRLGVVLPRSAFLVDGARGFRRWMFGGSEVSRIDFLLNNKSWVFPIHPQYTIALVAARRVEPSDKSEVMTTGPSASQAVFDVASVSDGIPIPYERLGSWTEMGGGPGFEVPLLSSSEAIEVFDKIRRGPRFTFGYPGIWSAFPIAEFHETADKKLFKYKEGVPVWKGRSFDQYEPHGNDPAGFAKETDAIKKLQAKRTSSRSAFRGRFPVSVLKNPKTHPFYSARVAFRDVSRATDSRTVRACLIPPETFLTNTVPYLVFQEGEPVEQAFVLGVMNSLAFDWQARRFVETHLNFYVLDMFCFPPPEVIDREGIGSRVARLSCVDDRFDEFADACGVECGPLKAEERDRLRAELDALVAHAYGLTESDLDVVFSDFTQNAVPDAYRDLVRISFSALA